MDEIKFIRDDVQEKKIKQLQEILDILSVKPKDADVEAAERFFYSLLKAAQRIAEKKKEESAREEKLKEIERKTPPLPRALPEFQPEPLYDILKDLEKPAMPPPTPLPEIPEIPAELPKPEDFKRPEEQPKIEEAIEHIKGSYPLILFKSQKGEAISQINLIHDKGKIIYELTEPEIDYRLVEETKKLIQKKFQKDKKVIKDEKFITNNIKKAFKKVKIDYTDDYKEEIKYFLQKDMLGLGRIDPLIHDPNVQTVICDGLNKPVKIALGPGLEVKTNITYMKKEELDDQVKHLGLRVKQDVSENNPVVEGTFYQFKIQATLGLGEAESKFMIRKMP